jgi:hypothetical protein
MKKRRSRRKEGGKMYKAARGVFLYFLFLFLLQISFALLPALMTPSPAAASYTTKQLFFF